MVGLVESPALPSLGLGFSILHQKVELDIDFLSRSLKGKTEITVSPHSKDIKSIRLNCRQCQLTRLSVNGKPATSMVYDEPYQKARLPWQAGVHQFHLLRQKLEGHLQDPPPEELVVTLARNLKIEELDPFSMEAQTPLLARSDGIKQDPGEIGGIDLSQVTKTVVDQDPRFTPIVLYVEFAIDNIRDGMQFVGWEDGDMRYPHAFTDNISSRCTWEISIKCPKTIGDAIQSSVVTKTSELNGTTNGKSGSQSHQSKSHAKHNMPSFSDEEKALDIGVLCSGDMTDEITDPANGTKKTTTFFCTTPVAPQHIGFAIGPFEHVNLAEFRESDEDDKLGQNAVPVHGFCLPGRTQELRNTCLPIAKAVDFFTLTYGSYPFSSYKICFVDDMVVDCAETASLSLCSSRLLFPEEIIEPLDRVTRQLVHGLACQWIGINITAKERADTWAVVGIAHFITDVFMKKLSGNNEYRYHQKRMSDRVCELDVARPSMYDTGALLMLEPSQLEFIAIKAPLVLFILDRRLAKTSGSSGLSRIVSRIFLNAKVGEIPNSALATPYFIKQCERLGHAKLDTFFSQWVFGAGCPRFRVAQRFNKKKLVVEMTIQQAQGDQPTERDLDKETFVRDVKEERDGIYAGPIQNVFTGPMTIRIHEADGTPYEHIVEVKDAMTKFEIPYNTKYKRLKRSRRQREKITVGTGNDFGVDTQDDVLLYCLGDVLQSEEEIRSWRLIEWSKEDEDRMSQESYEWIRMDADFEWICKMQITMPGYMYLSQLQQDRDVVAQLESVQYMAAQREHPLVSTILIRTLVDRRYFHGIRTAAVAALAKHAKDEIGWLGFFHLEKAFQEFFCFSDSKMTRSNDFSDRASYYIQCAIPRAIAKVRDNNGRAPYPVRSFLHEKLRYNDNSNNEFSDCHYLSILMNALAETISSNPAQNADTFDMMEDDGDDLRFHNACLDEIDRHRRIDEWIPSYQNILSTTALDCKRKLAKVGAVPTNAADFLVYTQDGCSEGLRINAFSNLMDLGMLRQSHIARWFLFVLGTDPSPHIREHMLRLLGKTLGAIAIGENTASVNGAAPQQDGLIIEQESSTEARQADLARRQTVLGALAALKVELGEDKALQKALWEAVESPILSLRELGELLDICSMLYLPETSMHVVLKYPRYWNCRSTGRGKLTFFHSNKIRTTPMPKKVIPTPAPPVLKRTDSSTGTIPAPVRTFLKPPKKPGTPAPEPISSPATARPSTAQSEEPKPRLTLKLKLKGAPPSGSGA